MEKIELPIFEKNIKNNNNKCILSIYLMPKSYNFSSILKFITIPDRRDLWLETNIDGPKRIIDLEYSLTIEFFYAKLAITTAEPWEYPNM